MTRMAAWSAAVASLGLFPSAVVVFAMTAEVTAEQAKLTKQLEAGKKALREGKYETAIRSFAKADKLSDGGSAIASLGLGAAHLQLSHLDEAELQAERALAVSTLPDEQAVAYNLLGTALSRKFEVIPHGQRDDRESTLTSAESALRKVLSS